ncbi:hypothetical protein DAEQUDRAFT_182259 [Daedalea quercina L-15889]|uniref:Uncharacterized protein n=1 Tax=Daedalea quercina L-15889 TaxID=1314783 RepID=A0A165RFA4_9APHY|nr:hypothetical protein DAEQUDRAFT_182259 [Daedalea quercina L-15889]
MLYPSNRPAMASPSRIPAPRHSPGGVRFPSYSAPPRSSITESRVPEDDFTKRTISKPVNKSDSPALEFESKVRSFSKAHLLSTKPRESCTEGQHRASFLTHARRTSIPKSPRKVFHLASRLQVQSPTPVLQVSGVSLGQEAASGGMPKSSSVSIPAPTLTGPCLLMPTPSFVAEHSTNGSEEACSSGEAAHNLKMGRKQGMGWLKAHAAPSRAKESLMLATPSFVSLGHSNSAASFASKYSLWHGRRGGQCLKAGNGGDAGVVAPVRSPTSETSVGEGSTAPPAPVYGGALDLGSSAPAPPCSTGEQRRDGRDFGLPQDLLNTLDELEAVAEQIKALPVPDPRQHSVPHVVVSVGSVSSELERTGDASVSAFPVGVPAPGVSEAQKFDTEAKNSVSEEMPLVSLVTLATPSKLPRMPLGRAVSTPSSTARAPVNSPFPAIPRRAVSEQARLTKEAKPSRLPTTPLKSATTMSSPAPRIHDISGIKIMAGSNDRQPDGSWSRASSHSVPSTAGSVFSASGMRSVSDPTPTRTSGIGAGGPSRSVFKPRLSESVVSTLSAPRKVSLSTPVSKIAQRARHSGPPRHG